MFQSKKTKNYRVAFVTLRKLHLRTYVARETWCIRANLRVTIHKYRLIAERSINVLSSNKIGGALPKIH